MTFDMANEIVSGAYPWSGRRVLVTGGAGFVGRYLVEDLLVHGASVRVVDDLSTWSVDNLQHLADVDFVQGDLTDPDVARASVAGVDVVLHLAARASGMLRSMDHNPEVLRDNTLMSLHLLDACLEAGVERVLMISSSCIYPDDAPIPTPELPVNTGLPESVNEGYGWGERMLEIQSRYVYEKYGLPIASSGRSTRMTGATAGSARPCTSSRSWSRRCSTRTALSLCAGQGGRSGIFFTRGTSRSGSALPPSARPTAIL
jgi:hypothetical protein